MQITKRLLAYVGDHVSFFRSVYIYLPLAALLTLGSIAGVNWLTGRAVTADVGELVAVGLIFFRLMVLVAAVDLTQTVIFGYRSNKAGCSKFDDVYDAMVSFFLISLYAWLFWH